MKKLIAATLLTLATFCASAVTYTQTGGYSNTTSHSNTVTDNTTYRVGTSVVEATDTAVGGLDNTNRCSAIDCSSSDNITTGSSKVITKTNLVINTTGTSNTTSTTASCFSGSDMNGLSHMEGKSVESFATSGSSTTTASGEIVATTINRTHTTNGGAEVGSSFEKVVDTTVVSEVTTASYSTTGERITFTSSTGQ